MHTLTNNQGWATTGMAVLHPAFEMPQLGRKRRIWVCLPPGYHHSDRRYPVIYMQDGQNLFNNPDALFGSWDVDKVLNRVFSDKLAVILVGIENGREHRVAEYAPWPHPEHGGGEGKAYLDFICDTLKPFVDSVLRTIPDRENTGIMGSSMGGLISMYAALCYSEVFGMAGVFSPSLWFSRNIFLQAKKSNPALPVKILLMAGQQESESMVGDMLDLYELLLEAGHNDENLHYDLHSDGVHAEWFWAREFEHALTWLIGNEHTTHGGVSSDKIRFSLDTGDKQLKVRIDPKLTNPVLEIRDYCHDRTFTHPLIQPENTVSYAAWEKCLYSIRLLSGNDLVFSRRVHLHQLEQENE